MEIRNTLTRTLSPSEKRRKCWQRKNHSLDLNDSVVWPIRTRTRIFLPFFSWTDVPLAQLDDVIGSGKYSKVHTGRFETSIPKRAKRRFSVDVLDSKSNGFGTQKVAIKVINKSVVLSEAGLANQLNQETRIHLVCSNHSNILNMTKAWQDEHHLYTAFELSERGSLRGLFTSMQRPFPQEAVNTAAYQLASALEYIHNIGVIHRDVKMENILIANNGNLLLTDFGLAMWLGKREKTTSICGTLAYMAPEVLCASPENPYGQPADYWSLGVTLFALGYGKLPFSRAIDHTSMLDNLKSEYESVVSQIQGPNVLEALLQFDVKSRSISTALQHCSERTFIQALEQDATIS